LLSGIGCLKTRLYPRFGTILGSLPSLTEESIKMNVIGILAFMAPGVMQLVILAFIVMLLFGGSKLPTLMRNIGRSANEFKRGMAETDDETESKEKSA
jgi:sec-independent protein translocase protein TatA